MYCIGGNFRQRKALSKATARQLVRQEFIFVCSSVVRSSRRRSFALHIHEYFCAYTCGFVEKFSQQFNLVKNFL